LVRRTNAIFEAEKDSHMARTLAVAVLLALFLTRANSEEPQVPQFKSAVDFVNIHVVVRDRDKKFISGLQKNDFTVTDNGKTVPVAVLEEVKRGNEARPIPPLAASAPAATQGEGPTRLIVVLDLLHTSWLDQVAGREALIKAVTDKANSGVPVGLAVLNRTGLYETHVFFDDPKLLVAKLKRSLGQAFDATLFDSEPDAFPTAAGDVSDFSSISHANALPSDGPVDQANKSVDQVDELVDQAKDPVDHANELSRKVLDLNATERRIGADVTLDALRGIPAFFGTAPGRKIMVFATGRVPFSWWAFNGSGNPVRSKEGRWSRLYDVLHELGNKGITIYPIDLRRLSYERKPSAESLIFLNVVADETGGKACKLTNDLERCFVEAVNDASTYYSLGFYVKRANRKLGWQKVNIRVRGRRAEILARKGYLWQP
jgi:VWFA-related protein